MRSSIVFTLLIVLCPATAMSQSIEGVWTVDEIIIGGGPEEGRHTSGIQPMLFIFTKSHYSSMFVHGFEPRKLFDDDTTDAERLAAYDAVTANTGRYEIQDSKLTFVPSVAKAPNGMTGRSYTRDIEWDGNTFWLSFINNAGGWRVEAHYVPVED